MMRVGFTVVVAVLIFANLASAHQIIKTNKITRHFVHSNLRRFTSGYTSGSGYSSGGGTTSSPTTTTTTTGGTTTQPGSTKIRQSITFASLSLSTYKDLVKLLYEMGYASGLGLLTTDNKSYLSGAKCDSIAKSARRAGTVITFTAIAPPALATNARIKASAIVGDTSKLVTAIAAVKATDTKYSNIAVPTASDITAEPAFHEVIVSAAPTSSSISLLAVAAVVTATLAFN
jgi:hypothetical protein